MKLTRNSGDSMISEINESKKNRFIKKHPNLTSEQKEELISLYSRQDVPDNIIDWNIFNSFSYAYLINTVETFLKDREDKRNLSRAIEGMDYIKVFENTNEEGTEYLYLPLTWLGSKYLASDHFLPKIKVSSKQMDANDFSDNSAKNDDLSPGAKWCISLWTLPDLVEEGKIVTDENEKELRHEGKRYWLWYTSEGAYFLFYFRDYSNLYDTNKKIAFTLKQGSSKIEGITLADDTSGRKTPDIKRVQEYWNEHYKEYKSQIEHIQEVSKEEYPKFVEYETQKWEEATEYYNSSIREDILREYFTYNEETGRYDSKESLYIDKVMYLVKDGDFAIPLGVINGDFVCHEFQLKTLKNGPTEVKGNFDCAYNELKSLEGAPKYIEGDFDCSLNYLKTLKGAPEEVGGYFCCSFNKLKTLEYAPQGVEGDFYCHDNKLTTLKGAPEYVRGEFDCSWNRLTTLEYAPELVGEGFICTKNKLTTLKGAPKEIKGIFNCWSNKLTTLEYAPKKVKGDFCCGNNPLQSKDLSSEVKGTVYY